jgi:glycosyltransferase involved in cell wall biosynthesis
VKPRVTVLTATYNQAATVRTCVESVLAQTMPDWEMVVVDDGSTDGTPDVARAGADPRVRVLALEHAGIGRLHDRYNRALALAAGPLVAVLEGDDWWPPDKLAVQGPALEREGGAVLSFGGCDLYDGAGRFLARHRPPGSLRGRIPGVRMARLLMTHSSAMPFSPTVIVRAEAVRSIGGFRQAPGLPLVDFTTWLELTRAGDFLGSAELLGCYRFYPESVSNRRRAEVIEGVRRYSLEFAQRHAEHRGARRQIEGLHAYAEALRDLGGGRSARGFRGLARALRTASAPMKARAFFRAAQAILLGGGKIRSRVDKWL